MDTFYQGERGSGKTLGAVFDCLLDKCCRKEIWTNTPLHPFFNAKYFEYPDDLLDFVGYNNADNSIKYGDTKPKTLLLDEIDKWVNSRRSMTQNNIDFVNFISQARKLNMKIIYTSQFIGGYDKNLRALTNLFVQCIPLVNYLDVGYGSVDYPEPLFFKYQVYKLSSMAIKKICTYMIPREDARKVLYHLYKTSKVIVSA